jgi:ABC-type nitrate/sulfonate/bicarbonate transport system substrate-binding protein
MFKNKNLWAYVAIATILIVTLFVVFQEKTDVEQPQDESLKTEIRIARLPGGLSDFPLLLAEDKGFFEKEGLEVEFKPIQPQLGIPALLADEVDYIYFTVSSVTASQKDAPIKIVMFLQEEQRPILLAQPGLELGELKNIAFANSHSPIHYSALKLITENDLGAEIIAVDGSPAISTAMLTQKQVDAALKVAPEAFQLEDQGYVLLKRLGDSLPIGLTTKEDKIANNPEEIEKVISAVLSAVEFIKNNPEETKEFIFKSFNLKKNETNERIVEMTYSIIKETNLETGRLDEEKIATLIKFAKAGSFETLEDIESQTVTQEEVAKSVDLRFLK